MSFTLISRESDHQINVNGMFWFLMLDDFVSFINRKLNCDCLDLIMTVIN